MTQPQKQTQLCEKCRGALYILTNVAGRVHGELCSCFKCPECEGRGHIYIEDATGISSLRECVCAGLVRRLKKLSDAVIPGKFADKDFENYFPKHGSQKLGLQYASDFAKDFGKSQQRGLLFMGRPGLGKTHLAVSVIKSLILDKGADCKFVDFFQLLSDIRHGYSQDLSEQAIINPFVAAPVLVIDELAKGRNTEWELTMLDQIISSRYNDSDKITLFTTNYSNQAPPDQDKGDSDTHKSRGPGSGHKPFGKETLQEKLGERIYSRLVEMCRLVKLEGEDYRRWGGRAMAKVSASAQSHKKM